MQRKGIWHKALFVRDGEKTHCAVSNEWIANSLAMGLPDSLSMEEKLYQDSKEAEKNDDGL
jgi:hypothetical protein